MSVEFTKEELRDLVIDSYELMIHLPSPHPSKYEIKSRTKIKTLPEALNEFEDPEAAVTHFVKGAAYFLPRSDANLRAFLDTLLQKVHKIQTTEKDSERIREKIRYLIGYTSWGMDSVCNIFKKSHNEDQVKLRLSTMISTELKMLDDDKASQTIVDGIMKWKAKGARR